MTEQEPQWPDNLEIDDEVRIDGHTYKVVGTGPAEATLERIDGADVTADVWRWAVSNTVGIEISMDVAQETFNRMVDAEE